MAVSEEAAMKETLRELCRQAIGAAEAPSNYVNRSPLSDPRWNAPFERLPGFTTAVEALGRDERVQAQFGPQTQPTVALKFVFAFLGKLERLTYDAQAFEQTWDTLQRELGEPHRRFVIVTNLQNFTSRDELISIAENVTIRTRSYEELSRILLWSEERIDRTLGDDWSRTGGGGYVMLAETQQQKTPENLVLVNDLRGVENLSRALLALRLHKGGFVRTGVWFYARPEYFSIAIGGIASGGGAASWQPGLAYDLTAATGEAVGSIYELLGRLMGRDERQLRPIQIALNAFSSLYAREHYRADDRLVNAITALEALLRIDVEVAFRSAFRVAGILASSDDERVEIFDRMHSYYDTRSKIVHGSQLRERHQADLQNEEPLLQWTRSLLLGFLQLADRGILDDAFYDALDAAILHEERRGQLRTQMGIDSGDA
jgi:hypothetical protein